MRQLGLRIAEEAERCLDARFRLFGRSPETGLDCIGLVVWSCRAAGLFPVVPSTYGLRNLSLDPLMAHFALSGMSPFSGAGRPGDIVLTHVGPAQHHLLIQAIGSGYIHAHAGLRRVVRTSLLPGEVVEHFRVDVQEVERD